MSNFVEGNYEDKYNTKNPISKLLVKGFISSFKKSLQLVKERSKVKTICEIGVGEGELLKVAAKEFPKAKLYACDLSENEIKKAKKNLEKFKINCSIQDAQSLKKFRNKQFDLVICCEVLEHLSEPAKGLKELKRISNGYLIISVPIEPVWRILNISRGKYLKSFGNTPGHLQNWGILQFNRFISSHFRIIKNYFPFPWQMQVVKKTNVSPQENAGILSGFLRTQRFKTALWAMKGKNKKILDVGCGSGEFAKFAGIKDSNYYGVDIKEYWNENRKNMFIADITKTIPTNIKGKKFDYIIALAVIEHLKDPEQFLKKLKPLLSKNGQIIMTTPHPSGRKIHDLGAKFGLFSKKASEEHEGFLEYVDFKNMSTESCLKIKEYRQFLGSYNQLVIFKN